MNIDSSYFTKGRRYILNATNGDCTSPSCKAVNSAIQTFIDQYSPVFLKKVLGEELTRKLMEDNGEDDKLKVFFEGLKEPLADFVMFHILRYSGQRATIDGLVELKSGNTIVSPAVYQANVWNEMVDGMRDFCMAFPEMRVDQSLLTKITSCWV